MRLCSRAALRAAEAGLEFGLRWTDVYFDLLHGHCAVTNLPFDRDWRGPGSNPYAPSLDRIDNTRGYVPGNVRVVLWAVNRARGEWDDDVLRTVARALVAKETT